MSILLTVGFTHLLALMSPGPDLVLVVRNTLSRSKIDGYFTALGFALGVACHLTLGLLGLKLLIDAFPIALTLLRIGGALYLAYIGLQSWRAGQFQLSAVAANSGGDRLRSLREGLVTNLLNTKAMLFFIGLILNVLTPDVALEVRLAAVLLMVCLTALWFSLVARFLSIAVVRERFLRWQKALERLLAVLLWLLALKLSGLIG